MIEKLSLTYCLQAGPTKPLSRDEHLILKLSLGHPGFEFLKRRASPVLAGGLSLEVMETVGMCLSHLLSEVRPLAWEKL